MILSSVAISLSDAFNDSCEVTEAIVNECATPTWVPVCWAMLTPFFFMMASLFMKHLTDPKIGFESYTVSFGTTGLTASVMMIIGIT